MKKECQSCLFYSQEKNEEWGYCHRNPPQIVSGYEPDERWVSAFPTVGMNAFCGEYVIRIANEGHFQMAKDGQT